MTIGQDLAALRIQLESVYDCLHTMVLQMPTAPFSAVDSASYDRYVQKLDTLDYRLQTLERSLERMRGQGPAYGGPNEDAFRRKQREASFRDGVESVERLLVLCFDDLAALVAPDRRGTVKRITDLGKKADEILKALQSHPTFHAATVQKGPVFTAATEAAPAGLGVSSFVTLAIIAVVGLKKLFPKKGEPPSA